MSIDSIGASSVSALSQLSLSQPVQGAGGDADGDHDGSVSKAAGGHHRHGGMMKSVMQALGPSGVDASDPSSAGSDVSQAMHAFMHALFGAMHAMAGSPASGAAESAPVSGVAGANPAGGANDGEGSGQAGNAASGYSSPSTNLQSLIQTLGNGQDGSSTPAVANLQNAFQNLLTAMDGTAQAANGSPPSLQTFLQNLLPDLSAQPSLRSAAVGGLANTSA